mgnify:FL=1
MAVKKIGVLLRKLFSNGDEYIIYFKNRAKDVIIDETTNETLAPYVNKIKNINDYASKVERSPNNGYIMINGTNTPVYTHPTQPVNAGQYDLVTVDTNGHVTGASLRQVWDKRVTGSITDATTGYSPHAFKPNIPTGYDQITIGHHLGIIYSFLYHIKDHSYEDTITWNRLSPDVQNNINGRLNNSNIAYINSWDAEDTRSNVVLGVNATWHYRRKFRELEASINNMNGLLGNLNNQVNNINGILSNVHTYNNDINVDTNILQVPSNQQVTIDDMLFPGTGKVYVTYTVRYMCGRSTRISLFYYRSDINKWDVEAVDTAIGEHTMFIETIFDTNRDLHHLKLITQCSADCTITYTARRWIQLR